MKTQLFLEHHGLSQNPFSQEDAQSDPLFKQACSTGTFHPAWDKIYGSPSDPATAVVFGEKGSGKTALRLQIIDHLAKHNAANPDSRVFVVEYDDFNPFLDSFTQRSKGFARNPQKAISYWRLWDHMDAILALATTSLVDDLVDEHATGTNDPFGVDAQKISKLTRNQKRDLLLLTAYYDRTTSMHPYQRWNTLRKRLRYSNWKSLWDFGLGLLGTVGLPAILLAVGSLSSLGQGWPWLIMFVLWLPFLWRQLGLLWQAYRVSRQVRVLEKPQGALRQILSSFERPDLVAQPSPSRERSDDRYELLSKLQSALRTLGYTGILVIVDRVDEPHLINGLPDRMRDLLWPMFDNKFLKHSGLGFKLLLPIEVSYYLTRESAEFYERSRLDKQNMIKSLEWTGESLYDLANARMKACYSGTGSPTKLRQWFEDSVSEADLLTTLSTLRVPRHLFKFLHQLLIDHCNRFTDENPKWQINRETMQSALAVYRRDLKAFDLGMGAG